MIQGIDTKIVTQRSTDYMRENNANVKNAEFAQTMMAKMEKQKHLKEGQSVVDVKKSEQNRVDSEGHQKQEPEEERQQNPKLKKKALAKDGEMSTRISGNEAVGYEKNSSLDIEV